jgi:hypothetical protein
MVEQEFENLWKQVTSELERSGRSFADEKTTEDEARADYRKIANRRVRLGLVLSEIGERNKITISDEESQQALTAATLLVTHWNAWMRNRLHTYRAFVRWWCKATLLASLLNVKNTPSKPCANWWCIGKHGLACLMCRTQKARFAATRRLHVS